MTTIEVRQLGKAAKRAVVRKLESARIEQVLVAQAKARIAAGGDSEHKYPDLWQHPKSYRAGGQPLRDNGQGAASLTAKSERTVDGLRLTLQTPHLYMVYQHNGFKTRGPNFIPLTLEARRNHSIFTRLMKERSQLTARWDKIRKTAKTKTKRGKARKPVNTLPIIRRLQAIDQELEAAGLIEGETYIMAWNGVDVPQRKVFNMAPENLRELKETADAAIGG